MAISWAVKVTNVNPTTKRADVTAVRVADDGSESDQSYSMTNTPFDTPEDRDYVIAGIKGWIAQEEAARLAAKAFVGEFEQAAKIDLEAWELTRS